MNASDLPQQVAPVFEGWLEDEVDGIHEMCQKAGSAVQKKACLRAAGCGGFTARKQRCVWSQEQI